MSDEKEICSICLDLLDENLVTTVCKHTFHKECIGKWCKDVRKCPYCTRVFTLLEVVIDNPCFHYENYEKPEAKSSIFENSVYDFYEHEAALQKFNEAKLIFLMEKKKRQIKYELLPVAWHPGRVYDWCFDEDEKKYLHILWKNRDN